MVADSGGLQLSVQVVVADVAVGLHVADVVEEVVGGVLHHELFACELAKLACLLIQEALLLENEFVLHGGLVNAVLFMAAGAQVGGAARLAHLDGHDAVHVEEVFGVGAVGAQTGLELEAEFCFLVLVRLKRAKWKFDIC